jgi:hypothetical protein
MKTKTSILAMEEDFLVDLTFHYLPASMLKEFTQKIVLPNYRGNLNAAIQDLISKNVPEQDFIPSRITHVRNSLETEQVGQDR